MLSIFNGYKLNRYFSKKLVRAFILQNYIVFNTSFANSSLVITTVQN